MSFDTRDGTRGARQPRGRVARWMNKMMAGRVRRTGRGPGISALVLTTVGRKSGIERQVPVGWFPGGDDGSYLIVASAGGAARNPDWYRNLAAHPDQARIEIGDGREIPVTARELHGEEWDAAWAKIVAAAPRFAGYVKKTDRHIPVIRLVPRAT